MKLFIAMGLLTSTFLFNSNVAFAQSFQVVCAGSSMYGPDSGGQFGVSSQNIAEQINEQLLMLSAGAKILAVSAPMTSTGTGEGAAGNGNAHSISQLVCVTVTLDTK